MDAHDGALLKTEDGWEIRFERRLNHSPRKVWDAIVGPGQMSLWFDRTEFPDPIAVGGVIQFFHDTVNLRSQGRITALEPPVLIEWLWSSDFTPDQLMSWRIQPEGEGSRLIVRQRIVDESLIGRTAAGWHVCLDRMQAILDGRPADEHMARWPELFDRYKSVLTRQGMGVEQQGVPAAKA
jgi:uncharacterized protein YndB with AHSA1/START domain